MKDWMFNRMQESESIIRWELRRIKNFNVKAHKLDYKGVLERVYAPMQFKTMPDKYKEQIGAILHFCWKKDVLDHICYPIPFNGKLYHKWMSMPEELKELIKKGAEPERVAIFSWHYKEGMPSNFID